MISRSKKMDALFNFGIMTGQNPWFSFLTGFLIGQIDRVHFLRDLTGASVAVKMSVRRAAVWPHEPFKATVRGVSMPNTIALVKSVSEEDTPICVSLEFDHADETPWYQDILLPNLSFVKDPAQAAEEESRTLWQEIDRTLDVYRECRALFNEASPERRKELAYYMQIAESQMKELSKQMEDLNKYMKRMANADDRE